MHAVRTASGHLVCRVAFSPWGSWLAVAQPHFGVTLVDRASGEVVRTVGSARHGPYTVLAFLPDGRLAAGGSKGLVVYDPESGAVLSRHSRSGLNRSILAARGDLVLAGGPHGVVELLFPATPEDIDRRPFWFQSGVAYTVPCPAGDFAVGFRADANPVAVDLAAKRVAHALDHPKRLDEISAVFGERLPTLAFAAVAPRVGIGDGATTTVFDLSPAQGDESPAEPIPAPLSLTRAAYTLPPPDGWPADRQWQPPFALTPDGHGLLVKRPRERVQLWDVDAGALAAEWSWRLDGITCLAVAPDGLTAVAGARRGRLVMWDLA